MKLLSVLLAASLAANVVLLSVYLGRSPDVPSAGSNSPPSAASSAGAVGSDRLRAALVAGTAAELEAAGLSPALARELALGRTLARLAERARSAQGAAGAEGRWWQMRPGASAPQNSLPARRELAEALIAALGTDLGVGGDAGQLAFLPQAKRDALRRITQDYDEMFAKFMGGGPQLASDKEKLRLLRAERDRDIAALLTPEERLAYDLRTSGSGATVRSRYGDGIESEEEFAKIFALQKAFDERFPREAMTGRIAPETLRARAEAERQLESDVRAAVGEDRYAALRRAADADARSVDALAQRLNLPAGTTDQVLAAREAFAAESQRINNDASTPMPQRRAQIQELAARARADVTRALGAEAAEAYAQGSQWLNLLQGGMAYATTPPAGFASMNAPASSVYPVMPAGASSGPRQMIVTGAAPTEFTSGDRVITNSNVQVMTYSTGGGEGVPATTTVRPVIVSPQPAAPAAEPKR